MAGLKRFQYTTKDHAEIVSDCISRIKQTYGENYWNDFEEDNAGRMLIEAFAYIVDLLLYYLDRQANETYLPTAQERQNIINMCKLIGYTPKPAKSAQANVIFSIDEAHSSDIILPSGSQLETDNGLIFETQKDAVIKAGDLTASVNATEGETFEEVVGISDGTAWQEFYLQRSGVIEILNATINGKTWQAAETFAGQSYNDEVFTAEIDAWRRAEIFFGDGRTGKIPDDGERIIVRYRVGGGITGNVAPETITVMRDIATDTNGKKVQATVRNPDWASGGAEPESLDSIKLWAPRFFETQDRCVTQQDYETFATKYGGIAKAKVIIDDDFRSKGEANVIHVYVLTYGNTDNSVAVANQTLKDDLLNYLNRYKMLTDWLEIEDGKFKNVDFSGTVTVANGINFNNILSNINKALTSLMNVNTRDMGEPLRISDVYAAIDNLEGVSFVELITPSETIIPDENELLVLGNINFELITEK